jgi:hypothetical protein
MKGLRDGLRGALRRVAGALNKLAVPARGHRACNRTEIGSAAVESDENALLDRERQLRVLMSSWM